jgi:type I restriction enzyme S subunit
MQPYSYRDSGIEWLGKIPTHWKVTKIKNQAKVIPSNVDKKSEDNETPVRLCNYVDVYYNDYIRPNLELMEATANENELKKFQLQLDDVLITKDSEDPLDIAVPALVLETEDKLLCGYHLSMIRKDNDGFSGAYLFWVLKDKAIASQLYREATGVTRWAISSRHIKNSTFPLPSLVEQRAIAGFLDEACVKIDAAIQVKREQADKITKHYQARVYEVIKSGLHAGVQTKDSGSAWLGDVPKHWKVKKLKYLADILRGKFNHRPRNDPEFYNGDYPFIQTGDVSRADKYIQSYSQTLNERGYAVSKEFPAGTLTMTIAANIGDVAILNFSACFPDSVVGFKPHHAVELEFLYYMLLALRQDVMSTAILTTQLNLNIVRVGSTLAVVPPHTEQRSIVTYLNNLKQKTDGLSECLTQQIAVLEGYKKALVHECVTGKKQVFKGG